MLDTKAPDSTNPTPAAMRLLPAPAADPMRPVPWTVRRVLRETADTFTLALAPAEADTRLAFAAGQFNMLYAFGLGEVPISASGDPARSDELLHTIRAVGAVTRGLRRARPGDRIGVRGPFGTAWPVEEARGHDVVIVAGGIGLAPLRPAIHHLLAHRGQYGRVSLLYGARSAGDILYRRELSRWRGRFDLSVEVTVDRAGSEWQGRVGLVTRLVDRAVLEPASTVALLCGPEVMMRCAAQALEERGVPQASVYVSLERNMKCAVGLCGHCQLGPALVCRDGPVFRYDRLRRVLAVREV